MTKFNTLSSDELCNVDGGFGYAIPCEALPPPFFPGPHPLCTPIWRRR